MVKKSIENWNETAKGKKKQFCLLAKAVVFMVLIKKISVNS
jgi:hypothetical protein